MFISKSAKNRIALATKRRFVDADPTNELTIFWAVRQALFAAFRIVLFIVVLWAIFAFIPFIELKLPLKYLLPLMGSLVFGMILALHIGFREATRSTLGVAAIKLLQHAIWISLLLIMVFTFVISLSVIYFDRVSIETIIESLDELRPAAPYILAGCVTVIWLFSILGYLQGRKAMSEVES